MDEELKAKMIQQMLAEQQPQSWADQNPGVMDTDLSGSTVIPVKPAMERYLAGDQQPQGPGIMQQLDQGAGNVLTKLLDDKHNIYGEDLEAKARKQQDAIQQYQHFQRLKAKMGG